MAPVIAENLVIGLQCRGNRNSNHLLPNTGVHRTKQFSLAEQFQQSLLDFAN
jgi:hypothetical protein